MILIDNFRQVAAQIESERGVTSVELQEAIETALVAACRRKLSEEALLRCVFEMDTGEARIYQTKIVSEHVEDDRLDISLNNARQFKATPEVGDEIEFEVDLPDLGRIAAQTAKQVIVQRIREAEKNLVYKEYKDRVGEIITGTVQRVEHRNYLINLGKGEAVLGYRDQIPGETFQANETVRLYLESVEKEAKGTILKISRGHIGFLQRLFELEIPEIQDGVIEIVSISREPGKRAKVAVRSHDPVVGAVGTCVGHMGGRIQSIIKELGYEKIDVLEWHDDPVRFIASALKPAKINQVVVTSLEGKVATVVVDEDQLSLAIGKQGVNVRLSVKLTGWKLDIVSQKEYGGDGVSVGSMSGSLVERLQATVKEESENVGVDDSEEGAL